MRLKLKERHLGREQRRTKLIWMKCGGKTEKTETLMKFSRQTGPAMPWIWRSKGNERRRGTGGHGCLKKPWYCLLMLLLFTPPEDGVMGWRWKRDWRKSDPSLLAQRRRRRIRAEAPDTARDVKRHTVHAAEVLSKVTYSPSCLAFSIVFRNWPYFFPLPTVLAKLLCHLDLLLDGNWDLNSTVWKYFTGYGKASAGRMVGSSNPLSFSHCLLCILRGKLWWLHAAMRWKSWAECLCCDHLNMLSDSALKEKRIMVE